MKEKITKESTKEKIEFLIKRMEETKQEMKLLVHNYLVENNKIGKATTPESIPYKKIIREDLGLVI